MIGEVVSLRDELAVVSAAAPSSASRASADEVPHEQAALVAVAHGSSNPGGDATVTALARQVRRLAPVIDIRVAFVQHAEPSLPQALADAGDDAVVVPLLLSTGYHLTTDIVGGRPGRVADPLGPDQLLVTALMQAAGRGGRPDGHAGGARRGRLIRPARPPSRSPTQAELLAGELDVPVTAGVRRLRAADRPGRGRRPAAAAPAARSRSPATCSPPGMFHDRLAKSGADWVTEPLGAHPAVAALIIDRYRTRRLTPGNRDHAR